MSSRAPGASPSAVVHDDPDAALLRGERAGGDLVARAGVGAAAWVLLTAALAVPLAVVGWWAPWVGLPVALVALVVAGRLTRGVTGRPAPVWSVVAVVLVAVLAAVWAGATSAEHVVLRRDAGTYALSGQHLAQAHRLVVDVDVDALGGPAVVDDPQLTVGSPGFYAEASGEDTHVVPQFLAATPVWLSLGWWIGGWSGLLAVPALVLGLAVLAVGGLASRVVGPRWSPLAAALTAVLAPVVHAGRSTYSEPMALLVLAAGASLLHDATRRGTAGHWGLARRLGFGAGLLLSGTALVRVDALREVLLLLPVAALLVVRRHGAGAGLAAGLAVGTTAAAASALLTTRPYLGSIAGSLVPLLALLVLVGAASGAWVLFARRRPSAATLPPAAAVLLPAAVGLVALVLATRPLWQTVRQSAADPGSRVVAGLQLRQGLPVDGGRTYAEASLTWVTWWVGVPALLLALAAALWSARALGRALSDPDADLPAWAGLWLAGLGSVVLTLWRPGITPDHPWADRRLVPVVLPVVVLLAVAVYAGAVRVARRRAPTAALVATAAVGAVALTVPPALATAPFLTQRTELGQVAAVQQACRAFGPTDVAVLVDSRAANEWTQVLRGVCGVPTVAVRVPRGADPGPAARRAAQRVTAVGGRPVLVAAESPDAITALGLPPRQLVDLRTVEDQRLLERRPDGEAALDVDLWVAAL